MSGTGVGPGTTSCPELFLDHEAAEDKWVVITDDFGQCIQMSLAQLRVLVADVRAGKLDELAPPLPV
jgi:hypothetical protein